MFNDFQEQKKKELDQKPTGGMKRSDFVWPTPEKGTTDRAKVYEGRFLPDKNGNFYKKYFYHMFKSGDKWNFVLCPKTHNFENYCPLCSVTNKLYAGSASDKKMAYNYKRKEKFVCNFYIIDDPRDQDRDDEDKLSGSVRLYEFPGKVEMKLKDQIIDTKHGLGPSIFDPGEDGFNFILKVLATKRDKNNNVWPDYSQSEFARRSSAIGSESEINEIMDGTIDVNEYIKSLEKDPEDVIQVLKTEMLWDLVVDECNKYGYGSESSISVGQETETTSQAGSDSDNSDKKPDLDDDALSDDDDDLSDEDLLAELENMD